MFQHHEYGTSKRIIHYPSMLVANRMSRRTSDDEYTCADLQNGPPSKKPATSFNVAPPTEKRMASPPPIRQQADNITDDGQSSFAVVSDENRKPIAFLSDSWVTDVSLDYHFKLAFAPSYPVGTMVGRQCITLSAMDMAAVDEHVLVAYSNNDGKKIKEKVKVDHLKPADINKATKGLQVVVLIGEKKGQIFHVKSTHKKRRVCALRLGDDLFEEQWCYLCIVTRHSRVDCECAKYPNQ